MNTVNECVGLYRDKKFEAATAVYFTLDAFHQKLVIDIINGKSPVVKEKKVMKKERPAAVYAMVSGGRLSISRDFEALKAKAEAGVVIRHAQPIDVSRWLGEHPEAPGSVVVFLREYKRRIEWENYNSRQKKANYAQNVTVLRVRALEDERVLARIERENRQAEWTPEIAEAHAAWLNDIKLDPTTVALWDDDADYASEHEENVALAHGQG